MVTVSYFTNDWMMNIGIVVSIILFSFLLFLAITFIVSIFKKGSTFREFKKLPNVSVIIPAYNEENNIWRCLEMLSKSDYPAKLLEIIVIDDASKDSTVEKAKSFAKHSKIDIKVMTKNHGGKSEALNYGIKKSKNELVVTIDADAFLEPGALRKLVLPMADASVGASNAVSFIWQPKGLLGHFQQIEYAMNSLIRTSFSKVFKNSIWFVGIVACYKKSALKEVGYIKKDTLTEDMDICLELYKKGYNIVTAPDAKISTNACSLRALVKQRMRWYFGALQSLNKNRESLKKKSPAVMFLYFNQYWWTLFAIVFFPLTAYQVSYWWPSTGTLDIILYLVRWFSLWGPAAVLYRMPEWGLNFASIFGVSAGIITFFMSLSAIGKFKIKPSIWLVPALFFYFPYTIVLNLAVLCGLVRHGLSRKKYFIS